MESHHSHVDAATSARLVEAATGSVGPAAYRQFAYCDCGARLTGDSLQGLLDAAERHLAQHRRRSLSGAPVGADRATV